MKIVDWSFDESLVSVSAKLFQYFSGQFVKYLFGWEDCVCPHFYWNYCCYCRVKGLQKQLTEKEAMVKMYQRTPASLPRSSSVHTLSCSPLHSPRPSLIATTALTRPLTSTTASGSSNGDFVHARHVKTGKCKIGLWCNTGLHFAFIRLVCCC